MKKKSATDYHGADLFEFKWGAHRVPCEWILSRWVGPAQDDRKWDRLDGLPSGDRFSFADAAGLSDIRLAIPFCRFDSYSYFPQELPVKLHLELARIPLTPSGIMQFANRYGSLLTAFPDSESDIDASPEAVIQMETVDGEPYLIPMDPLPMNLLEHPAVWIKNIVSLRQAIVLSRLIDLDLDQEEIEENNTILSKMFCLEDHAVGCYQERVIELFGEKVDKDILAGLPVNTLEHLQLYPEGIPMRRGTTDFRTMAVDVLRKIASDSSHRAGADVDLSSDGASPLRIVIRPRTLESYLWLEFAQSINAGNKYRPCPHCGRMMLLGVSDAKRGISRADRQTCSGACREAKRRKENKYLDDMLRRGVPITEIWHGIERPSLTQKRWMARQMKVAGYTLAEIVAKTKLSESEVQSLAAKAQR
jgi:hypothetical protein